MIGKLPESTGPNMGPALDKFEAQYGFHGAPWCGIFAGHALQAAGLKVPHSVASVASILDLARNGDPPFVKGILPISQARPGDLATFGGAEHVAIITKIDAAGVHTIAGNTSQSNVSETIYSPSSVTGVVRPDYALAPGGGAGAGAAPASLDPTAPAAPTAPGTPPAAGVPGAASTVTAAPGAPATATPGVPASAAPTAPAQAVPGAGTPGTASFKAIPPLDHRPPRHTVQFLQAVQPSNSPPVPADAIPPTSQTPVEQTAATSPGAVPKPPSPPPPAAAAPNTLWPGAGDRSRASDFAERYVDPRLSRLARTDQDGGGRRRRQPATGIEPEPGAPGGGLAQWQPPRGPTDWSLSGQLKYLVNDLKSSYPGLLTQMNGAASPGEAATLFVTNMSGRERRCCRTGSRTPMPPPRITLEARWRCADRARFVGADRHRSALPR